MSIDTESEALTLAYSQAKAKQKGCDVRMPKPSELFIDLDTDEAFALFEAQWKIFTEHVVATHVVTPSQSGLPHRHVVVLLPFVVKTEIERVLMQAMLGSDPKRELLSWVSIHTGKNLTPSILFEVTEKPPEKKPMRKRSEGAKPSWDDDAGPF